MGGAPERSDKKGIGPIASAPCPWCKHSNDFREIHTAGMLEKGNAYECDGCHKLMVVVAVRTMPQVVLGQYVEGEIVDASFEDDDA